MEWLPVFCRVPDFVISWTQNYAYTRKCVVAHVHFPIRGTAIAERPRGELSVEILSTAAHVCEKWHFKRIAIFAWRWRSLKVIVKARFNGSYITSYKWSVIPFPTLLHIQCTWLPVTLIMSFSYDTSVKIACHVYAAFRFACKQVLDNTYCIFRCIRFKKISNSRNVPRGHSSLLVRSHMISCYSSIVTRPISPSCTVWEI